MAVYKRDIVDINLETGNIHRTFLNHSIGMKDQKADHFGVRVFRDGEPVNLTGVSVQGVFMPPQGSPIAITSGNIVSENVAEVVLPQACYNYDGQFTLAIKLVDSTNSVTGTVRIVDGMVDNTHASGTVAPTSAVPTYQEVLSAYEQAIAVIGNSVRFDQSQSLTDTQKGTARTNIAAASESELSDVKSALVESLVPTTLSNWASGIFTASTGENYNDSLYIRNPTKVGVSNGYCCVSVSSGYSMLIYAWSGSTYIGRLHDDGTFEKNSSNPARPTFYVLSSHPSYDFKIVIRREPESSDIQTSEGSNVTFYKFTDDSLTLPYKAADSKSTGDEFVIVKNALHDSNEERVTFMTYGEFAIGGLNADGTLKPSETMRVSSANLSKLSFERNITVSVKSGYAWGYIPFTGNTPGQWSGWFTTPTKINAGTSFVVQIRREPESATPAADVSTFVSALTFVTKAEVEIQANALAIKENTLAIKADESALEYSGSKIYETILTNGTPANPSNDECVATDYVPAVFGQTIKFITDREAETGYTYIYGIYGYNSSKTKIVEISPTSRKEKTSEYTVINNNVKYIRYAVAQIAPNDSIKKIRVSSFNNCFVRIIVTDNVGLPFDISYYGKPINTKMGKVNISQSWITQPSPVSIDAAATQGFAIYGGVVFQLYSGSSHIALIDYESGDVITTMAADVAHGNSMQFLNEFYDEDDEFPMAIIADGLTNEAYKVRVTRSSITVIETYAFDISKCGYYVSTAVDALNDIVYTIGYTNDSYTSDGSGTNRMIIAAWDINRTTAVGDDLSPLFLESFTVPFMHTIQGPTFFNGLFFVFSSPGTAQNPTKLYAIDPGQKKIVNRFDNFKNLLEEKECESLYFYEHNGGGVRCYVKGNTSSLAYYILDFNS